jgi:hypothetical protein
MSESTAYVIVGASLGGAGSGAGCAGSMNGERRAGLAGCSQCASDRGPMSSQGMLGRQVFKPPVPSGGA